jgi:hypothetical protein
VHGGEECSRVGEFNGPPTQPSQPHATCRAPPRNEQETVLCLRCLSLRRANGVSVTSRRVAPSPHRAGPNPAPRRILPRPTRPKLVRMTRPRAEARMTGPRHPEGLRQAQVPRDPPATGSSDTVSRCRSSTRTSRSCVIDTRPCRMSYIAGINCVRTGIPSQIGLVRGRLSGPCDAG